MGEPARQTDRLLALAALGVGGGAALSGPVGMALAALRPQPEWRDAATFSAHFHALQQAPFWFGFLLVAACGLFVARGAALMLDAQRTRALVALLCAAAFAAMICINYTLQVAVVPYAARTRDPAVAYLALANAGAICWAFEMFGYALLGVATWLLAPLFGGDARGRWIARLLVANGVVSLAGAVVTAADLAWVHSLPGLVSFALWNVLLIGCMGLITVDHWLSGRARRHERGEGIQHGTIRSRA